MHWLKSVGSKIATGAIFLAVGIAGLAWWQATPETREHFFHAASLLTLWTVIVIIVPWGDFGLSSVAIGAIGWTASRQSNAASACLIVGLTFLESLALYWATRGELSSGSAWAMYWAAVLIAGVYNTLACDWIAEQVVG